MDATEENENIWILDGDTRRHIQGRVKVSRPHQTPLCQNAICFDTIYAGRKSFVVIINIFD